MEVCAVPERADICQGRLTPDSPLKKG
jgi:hypothetical protein